MPSQIQYLRKFVATSDTEEEQDEGLELPMSDDKAWEERLAKAQAIEGLWMPKPMGVRYLANMRQIEDIATRLEGDFIRP